MDIKEEFIGNKEEFIANKEEFTGNKEEVIGEFEYKLHVDDINIPNISISFTDKVKYFIVRMKHNKLLSCFKGPLVLDSDKVTI